MDVLWFSETNNDSVVFLKPYDVLFHYLMNLFLCMLVQWTSKIMYLSHIKMYFGTAVQIL